MKIKNLFVAATLFVALVMVSCSKDQRAVKKLDGEWTLVKENGSAVDPEDSGTVKFDKCKLKKDEYCDVTFTIDGAGITAKYKVEDKGETLVVEFDFLGTTQIQRMTIKELTKDKLVLEQTEDGDTYTAEYEKK